MTICQGFHLCGGEHVQLRLLRADGTEERIEVTVSVIMGRKGWDDENSSIDSIVVRES